MADREESPGGLDTEPLSAVEGFYQQEALRYRRALIAIEQATMDVHEPLIVVRVSTLATEALDEGDEAAG